jgi:tetratricopeptide repeat protein 21B
MSKEFKAVSNYLLFRRQYDDLLRLCEVTITKKGKDPIVLFWKAFCIGMTGNSKEAIRQMDGFSSRKDMQFATTSAIIYFHSIQKPVDREAIETLKNELSITEDVTVNVAIFEINHNFIDYINRKIMV